MRVLITGADGGFGSALMGAFKSAGHDVYPHYRDHEGRECLYGDTTNLFFPRKLQDYIVEHEINVFINNAAIVSRGPAEKMDKWDVINMIDTNLRAPILMCSAVYAVFKEQGYGKIINVNSLAGIRPTAGESVYSATKHGLSGYSQSLQLEAIGTGVTILDIYPGAMKTGMSDHRDDYENLLDPLDVARYVERLCSDESIMVTESVIRRPA